MNTKKEIVKMEAVSTIEVMKISDYEAIFDLWMRTTGMGLRSLDDSKEGIEKFLNRNPNTNFVYREGQRVSDF
jgi:hypothetical protein